MKVSRFPARLACLPLAIAALVPLVAFHPAAALAQAPALRETVVTATRFPEPARFLPYGVSVITAQEIERSGAATVNEALMRILGVPGRQDLLGGGEYTVDLRGFGTTADTNQVVVLDGVRLSEADLGGTRLAGIPIESVERIEVLRGSGAVLYGEGATGGVIAITTKAGAGKSRPNGGSVYAGAGSYGLRDLRATANVGSGGFSLDAAAQKRRSDGHRDNFASEFDAASVTGQWAGENLRIGARLSQDDLDTGLPGALSTAQYATNPRQASTPLDRASIDNQRVGVFAETQLGAWQLGFDAARRGKDLRSTFGGFPFDYDIDATNASLRARHAGRIAGLANALVLGIDHNDWERAVLGAFGSTATQRSRAVYARDELTLPTGTRLSAGVRTERFDKQSNAVPATRLADRLNAWELGANHPVTNEVTVYGRVGRSYRLANVDEFTFTTPGSLLRPQTSRDLELGARWQLEGSRVEARLFRHELEDEIGFDPAAVGPFGPFGANTNFDPTRRQGLELDASHALTREVTVRANAMVRRATFRAGPYAGNDVPLVARRTLALRADWTPGGGHTLSGGVNWVSSRHPDFANTCSMPSYTTADLRYAYEWRQAEFSLGATNLFDRRFYTQAFACAGGQPSAIYPEPGRAVTAAVRVKF